MAQQDTKDMADEIKRSHAGRKGHRASRGIAERTGFDGRKKPDDLYIDLRWPLEHDVDTVDPRFPLADRIFVPARTAIRVDDIQSIEVPNPDKPGKKMTVKVATFCLVSDTAIAYTVKYGTLGYALGIFKNEEEEMPDTFQRTFGETGGPSQLAQQLAAAVVSGKITVKSEKPKATKAGARTKPTGTNGANHENQKSHRETLDDLMKIEPNATFELLQTMFRSGEIIGNVGDKITVVKIVEAEDKNPKHRTVDLMIANAQHNVLYAVVYKCIREPRPGDKVYQPKSQPRVEPVAKSDELSAAQAVDADQVYELDGNPVKLSTGNYHSFRKGTKVTVQFTNPVGAMCSVKIPHVKETQTFILDSESLTEHGRLMRSTRKTAKVAA